jgi:hypothetical protein
MTAATITGIACAEDDTAAQYHRSGRLASAESFRELIPDLPAAGVPVDLEHNGDSIGQLVHGELDADGRLHATAVVNDADWLLDYDGEIFYSPELICIGEGVATRAVSIASHAALTGLSITTTPATVGAQPLEVRAGDIRRSGDRRHWPVSWRTQHPQLARAVDALPANTFTAESYRCRSITREHTLTELAPGVIIDETGERIPANTRAGGPMGYDDDGRPLGPLHIRPCQILSVGGYPVRTR